MKIHPAANIFPLLEGDAYQALVADIRDHGLREAIWRDPSKRILDGRNRLNACKKAGVKPRFQTYEGDDVVSFVISLNLHRRHLNESQRAMAAARLANLGEGRPKKTASIEAVSQKVAAGLVNVSRPSVGRAKKVLTNCDKKLVAAVDRGEVTVADAASIATKGHPAQIKALEMVAEGKASTVKAALQKRDLAQRIRDAENHNQMMIAAGAFDVIVATLPWEDEEIQSMPLEELKKLDIPRASNCVLWLWTTSWHMFEALLLIRCWLFVTVDIFTWVKDIDKTKTEFCIMATCGKPKFNRANLRPAMVIHELSREKGRKPNEFYKMVEGYCIGRRLDFFSHERRDGWEQHGYDCDRFKYSDTSSHPRLDLG